jgi:hypothetical protein
MIVFTDRVVVPAHVMVRFLDSESLFLNLETERYFGLDSTGTRMWQLLTGTANIEGAYQGLLEEFEVEAEVLRSDLLELLNKLIQNNLIQVVRSDVGTASVV